MTQYVVIRFDWNPEFGGYYVPYIYSKKTSNVEIMIAYRDNIRAKFPGVRVEMVTKEKAEEVCRKLRNRRKERERLCFERLEQRSNQILSKLAIAEAFGK